MIVADHGPEVRARRAYELGRLRWALTRAVGAVAITAIALAGCPSPGAPAACAAALGVAVAACLWRGGSWARGARLGFLAGLAPCLLPAAFRAARLCGGASCVTPPGVCLAAGVVAGLLLGAVALRLHGDGRCWLAAALVSVLAGAIGCVTVGVAGLAGMALGIFAGAMAPVLARRTA